MKLWQKTETAPPGKKTETPEKLIVTAIKPHKVWALGRWLAFAINDDSIESTAVERRGDSAKVLDLRKVYFGQAASDRQAKSDLISESIKSFVDEFGGRKPRIVLVVDGPETALRSIKMPLLKGKKLKAAIDFEARNRLPFPIHDCHSDFSIDSRQTSGRKTSLRISLLAATRRVVNERLDYFHELGLTVNHIYNAYQVIGLLLNRLPLDPAHKDFALINVQRGNTHISYFSSGHLQFHHTASIGATFLTNRSDDNRFDNFAKLLAREIQNSMDYYTGQYSSQFANRVFVYGDLSYTDDLVSLLSDQFGFEFRRFPAERLSGIRWGAVDPETCAPVSLATLGAAICPARLPNLLPKNDLDLLRQKLAKNRTAAAMVVLAASMGLHSIGQYRELTAREDKLSQLSSDIEQFERSDLFGQYKNIKAHNQISTAFLKRTQGMPSMVGLCIKELTRLTPSTIRFRRLDYGRQDSTLTYQVSGTIAVDNMPPELVLAEYVEDLIASPMYHYVKVDRYAKRAVNRRFELDFTLSLQGIS
ncbi:MAG: pilus assembly protein PilM [candidate division Zixibacteria bacterium]